MDKEKRNNAKMKIWVYAVVLFTSAFIVLLLTAYSQIKMNRSIDKYKHQINEKDNENTRFEFNLNSALQENNRLNEEVKRLLGELENADAKINGLEENQNSLQKDYEIRLESYEKLFEAENLYKKKDYIGCDEILQSGIRIESLSIEGLNRYNDLWQKNYKKASLSLYKEGMEHYNNKKYYEASERFVKSFQLVDDEYYSDDSYYFAAYAEFKLDNTEKTKLYLKELLTKYPESIYVKSAEGLLKKIS